jgi:hypothetical protein
MLLPHSQDSYDVFTFNNKASFFADQIAHLHPDASACSGKHLKFFDGAFAYHWSTYWDNGEPPIEGTYFHALLSIMSSFVDGKTANLYGEMYQE